jgi:hypothetical protein
MPESLENLRAYAEQAPDKHVKGENTHEVAEAMGLDMAARHRLPVPP